MRGHELELRQKKRQHLERHRPFARVPQNVGGFSAFGHERTIRLHIYAHLHLAIDVHVSIKTILELELKKSHTITQERAIHTNPFGGLVARRAIWLKLCLSPIT